MKRLAAVAVSLLVAALMAMEMVSAQAPPDNSGPAQGASDAQQSANTLVARLSLINGTVSTQRSDTGEWVAGKINTPLVSGDKVAASAGARAEVEIDYADTLRLGDNSQANLVTLNQNQIQIQLGSGLADYIVGKDAQPQSEIDTPNVAIHPRGQGVFRILVSSDSDTTVTVRQGEADITTPQGSTTLHDGQMISVQGTDNPEYQITDASAADSWDQWNQDRDNTQREAQSVANTNSYYTGVSDLDAYGYWTTVPGYGRVWVPNGESGDWSPYSNGNWEYEPYWGWTWVDYSPWGWAPYHYGRWFVYGPRWVWWPGPITPFYRPIWAPAYVSFFGWGGGWGFGMGFGNVGWLAIGPGDGFRPWWGGRGFERARFGEGFGFRDGGRGWAPLMPVGHGRIEYSNLRSLSTNARVRSGLVRMPGAEFGHGHVGAYSHVTAAEVRSGARLSGHLPATPTRASFGSTRRVSAGALPHGVSTHFFGSTSRATAPGVTRSAEHTFRAAPSATRPGFQHFGASPGARAGERSEQPARTSERGVNPGAERAGWQHFQPNGAAPNRGGFNREQRPPLSMDHPIVRDNSRSNPEPRYNSSPRESMPRESAPRQSAPRYSAPRESAPHYSAPSRPSGGGSFHPSGGGGHPSGGGHSHGH